MQAYFITSTGTGMGKTLVTCALVHQYRCLGKKICALKPVISGYDPVDPASDTALIVEALGQPATLETYANLSPWRFAAPLSPHIAAKREGREVPLSELLSFCRAPVADILLIEGAGGLMAPLNDTATTLDWIAALAYPVILVAGSYLGALSHTLTALEALRARKLVPVLLIVSESENPPMPMAETMDTLRRFAPGVPCISIPRLDGDKAYRHVAYITRYLQP